MARAVFIDLMDCLAVTDYKGTLVLRHADVPGVLAQWREQGRKLILFVRMPLKHGYDEPATVQNELAAIKVKMQSASIPSSLFDGVIPIPYQHGESALTISNLVQRAYAATLQALNLTPGNAVVLGDTVIDSPAAKNVGLANITLPSVNHLRLLARNNLERESPLAMATPLLDSVKDGAHEEVKIEKMPLKSAPVPPAPQGPEAPAQDTTTQTNGAITRLSFT